MSTQRKIGWVFWLAAVILLSHVPSREFYGILCLFIAFDLWKADKR